MIIPGRCKQHRGRQLLRLRGGGEPRGRCVRRVRRLRGPLCAKPSAQKRVVMHGAGRCSGNLPCLRHCAHAGLVTTLSSWGVVR